VPSAHIFHVAVSRRLSAIAAGYFFTQAFGQMNDRMQSIMSIKHHQTIAESKTNKKVWIG